MVAAQLTLFQNDSVEFPNNSSTFVSNMALPVHRWYRYSAGFSATWVQSVVRDFQKTKKDVHVFDPFAGSATTLIAAEDAGASSIGLEAHPFVVRLAAAKLLRLSDPQEYAHFSKSVLASAKRRKLSATQYPDLIHRCFSVDHLDALDRLRTAYEQLSDDSPASQLTWLTLVTILRSTSHVGTAQWQYVLPNKSKKKVLHPFDAFTAQSQCILQDMTKCQGTPSTATLIESDARTCEGVPSQFADLVITSPPYPNNYDYADATRLEMMFMKEIEGWAGLQTAVRTHLVRSCSQHTTNRSVDLETTLADKALSPIRDELSDVCHRLDLVRQTKGGKKNYHLMVASYFLDLANTWNALRRVCKKDADVCFVIGDSAPYGVYVHVHDWLGRLAVASGFTNWSFEKLRDRNIKWKNRKHDVPLCEGRLWVKG